MKDIRDGDGKLIWKEMELEDLNKEYTQNELAKLDLDQMEGRVWAPNANYIVVQCPVCKQRCLGKDWNKHKKCFGLA